ncbi:PEP-CTERM sorting domain-containing protein [Citrifermentans pelophilum]|nr:PEP-CTERM sorting domain-containing protein [Geoanaerobacter pelophilus]
MITLKSNRIMVAVAGLLSLAIMLSTAFDAYAISGAQSSASVSVDPFNDPRMIINRVTTETITTSSSPSDFQINSTQSNIWEDALVESTISDGPYKLSTSTASSSGSMVNQLSLALSDAGGDYSANAQTVHDIDFQIGLGGALQATAFYDVLLQLYADNGKESASGYLLAGIYLRNLTQLTESSDVVQFSYSTSTFPEEYFTSLQGSLSTSLDFATGDYGSFRVIVDGNAFASSQPAQSADPVPEPSTLALFGIGAIGAALVRKRSRR